MSIDDLNKYEGICANCEAISQYMSLLNSDADPLMHELAEKLKTESAKRKRVERWIDSIPDREVRTIAYYRFIKKMKYEKICMKLYGYADYWFARQVLHRYLKKHLQGQEGA